MAANPAARSRRPMESPERYLTVEPDLSFLQLRHRTTVVA
jgi:hypothetical protein